jgi:hypothetical protein
MTTKPSKYESATPASVFSSEASHSVSGEASGAHGAADPDVAELIEMLLGNSSEHWQLCRKAAAALQRQAEELAEVSKDAQRYRWMRDGSHGFAISAISMNIGHDWEMLQEDDLDDAIDAAMKDKS